MHEEKKSSASAMRIALASGLGVAVAATGIIALIFGLLLVKRHEDVHGSGELITLGPEAAKITFELDSPVVGDKDGTRNAPLKVRGGAITFMSKKFAPHGIRQAEHRQSYCTSIPRPTLTRADFDNDSQYDNKTLPLGGGEWSITIHTSNSDAKRGVIIKKVANCTPMPPPPTVPVPGPDPDPDDPSDQISVSVELMGDGDKFYAIPADPNATRKEMRIGGQRFRRYFNSTCNASDKDLCERMIGMDVVSDNINTHFDCSELDCTIALGQPLH